MQMISIHAPRTGSDKMADEWKEWAEEFQSTLPARGATPMDFSIAPSVDISIHAPRTGSDWNLRRVRDAVGISIHAPRTGSDLCRCRRGDDGGNFNPRSPHGERLGVHRRVRRDVAISIHAPRTGSDLTRRRRGTR